MSNKPVYDESMGDWIIDTDPGIDDAFALTLAMNFIKDHLKLISIESGNTGLEQCYINAKKLCAINGFNSDISKGTKLTLSTQSLSLIPGIHGHDGLFDLDEFKGFEEKYDKNSTREIKQHSAVEIVKLCKEYKKNNQKLNILTLGPLTNVALAFMLDPSIVNDFNRFVVMGGSYSNTGNVTPSGEFNFACDNVAAKVVLDNFKNIVVYCWEPSFNHLLFPEHIEVNNETDRFKFITRCIKKKVESEEGGIYADYGAALVAFYPQICINSEKLYTDVVVDATTDKQAIFLVNKNNIFDNRDKEMKEVIYDLDIKLFRKFVNDMIS